jgi:hypothetical protein
VQDENFQGDIKNALQVLYDTGLAHARSELFAAREKPL